MDRRHRSASRSRREDRRSTTSMRSSHDSVAGNLSPGRQYPGHGYHGHGRREGSGGGFFKSLFNRRDKHPAEQPHQQQLPPQHHMAAGQPPSPPTNSSPGSKLKALLSFSPHRPAPRHPSPSPATRPETAGLPSRPIDDNQAKGMQHTVEVLQESYKNMESRLAAEQRAAQEWKEKWNYQNFKLNLMVDMLVLRVLELEQPSTAGTR